MDVTILSHVHQIAGRCDVPVDRPIFEPTPREVVFTDLEPGWFGRSCVRTSLPVCCEMCEMCEMFEFCVVLFLPCCCAPVALFALISAPFLHAPQMSRSAF